MPLNLTMPQIGDTNWAKELLARQDTPFDRKEMTLLNVRRMHNTDSNSANELLGKHSETWEMRRPHRPIIQPMDITWAKRLLEVPRVSDTGTLERYQAMQEFPFGDELFETPGRRPPPPPPEAKSSGDEDDPSRLLQSVLLR